MLTSSQIQVPTDVDPLLNTTADCLHFVTKFFDAIGQSAPHIYHSALLLAPKSSVVRKLYGQQICSPAVRVITGIPASWDSCTATLGTIYSIYGAVWSPCGKFIAARFMDQVDVVEVWDSTTLERVSGLRPPTMPVNVTPHSLAFSPNGHLLACTYSPARESNRLVPALTSLSILNPLHRLCVSTPFHIVIWDIQTGMVINDITTWDLGEIVFSWDQSTITSITGPSIHIYNRLSGERVHEGELLSSPKYQLGAHWVHEESLQFAISSKIDQELVISIQELQPTSDHLFHVVKSFPISPQDGTFSFSPVSLHASFVSGGEIVILDVQDSKILFQSKDARASYRTAGYFSHDGCFCVCGVLNGDICIWERTSTGYVPQSSLRPRFSWHGFLWSPTSISILCWGLNVVQLLHPDTYPGSISPNMVEHVQFTDHIVVCSVDQTHIIIGQCGGGHITALDYLGTKQQSVDTNATIRDIKIMDNTVFVIDGNRLSSLHLTIGGQVQSACGIRRENTPLHIHMNGVLALSNNCTQVAFTSGKAAFLYDVEAQKVLGDLVTDGEDIFHIQFSPDGSQLWFIVSLPDRENCKCYCVELDSTKDPCFGGVTIEDLEDEWSLDSLFRSPGEYRIVGKMSKWVSGSKGNVLWLPVDWRRNH